MHPSRTRECARSQGCERIQVSLHAYSEKYASSQSLYTPTIHIPQAAFTGEAKGAREATKQLGAQVQALDSEVSGSENKMSSLLQTLRMLENRQKEQLSAAISAKSARGETEQLREQVRALGAVVSGSESKMSSLLQAVRTIETRQQEQHSMGAVRAEEQVSRQQMQVSEGGITLCSIL